MITINPGNGKRILIIEREDLIKRNAIHNNHMKQVFEGARAFFDIIIVISSTSAGLASLPKFMRSFPLSPTKGDLGTSYWKMEKDEYGFFSARHKFKKRLD